MRACITSDETLKKRDKHGSHLFVWGIKTLSCSQTRGLGDVSQPSKTVNLLASRPHFLLSVVLAYAPPIRRRHINKTGPSPQQVRERARLPPHLLLPPVRRRSCLGPTPELGQPAGGVAQTGRIRVVPRRAGVGRRVVVALAAEKKQVIMQLLGCLWWPGVSCDVVVRAFKSNHNGWTARAST